jgi:RNA polymerase sigma factor (sigma-70 family)
VGTDRAPRQFPGHAPRKLPREELTELVTDFGDPEAQTRFYEITHRRLRRNLRVMGWPESAIDDVVPDAYLTLFRNASRLHSPSSSVAWLTTVAKRQLIKNAASTNRDVLVEDMTVFANLVDPSLASSPDVAVDGAALLEHLRTHLAEPDFTIVELLSSGYTSSEVLGQLGVRTSRLAELRARAQQALRETEWRHVSRPGRVIADPQPRPSMQSTLESAIRRLPDRQREVLNYRVYAGKTPKEIAAQLGITANSARVSLYQARESLAKRLMLSAGSVNDLLGQLSAAVRKEPAVGDVDATEMIAVVFDIARLAQRPSRAREPVRQRLRILIDRVLPEQALAADTGDAILVFVPMEAWRPGFTAALTMRVRRHLADDNARHRDKLHVRALLDIGRVNIKAKAFSSGLGINLLRISESDAVRQAAPSGMLDPLTVFVSDRVHTAMQRGHALPENMCFTGPLIVPNGRHSLTFWQLASTENRSRLATG